MQISFLGNYRYFLHQHKLQLFICLILTLIIFSTACAASSGKSENSTKQVQANSQNASRQQKEDKNFSAAPADSARIKMEPVYNEPDYRNISSSWVELVQRLKKDMPEAPVDAYFAGLKDYSGRPMAIKIEELYKITFLRAPVDPTKKKRVPTGIYRNVVTKANMEKCQSFLAEYKKAFDLAEKKYDVSREILVSLLLIETRLGTFLGNSEAFWSLASMAASTSSDKVKSSLKLGIKADQESWLQSKLDERSEWAYKELKALIVHCKANEADPKEMPGSVYGAIGICQFMPSNLAHYTADGDGDGIIDLFNEPDAIASAARYLHEHGWNSKGTVPQQRKTLRRYNNSTRYANTILTMAYSLKTGVVHTVPPDAKK